MLKALLTDGIELALVMQGHSRFIGMPSASLFIDSRLILGARSGQRLHERNLTPVAMQALYERYVDIDRRHNLGLVDPLQWWTEHPIDHYVALVQVEGVISLSLAGATDAERDALSYRHKPLLFQVAYLEPLKPPTRITSTSGFIIPYDEETGTTTSKKKMKERHLHVIYDFCDMLERLQKEGKVDQKLIRHHHGYRFQQFMTARERQGIIVIKHERVRGNDTVLRVTGKWRERFIQRFNFNPEEDKHD